MNAVVITSVGGIALLMEDESSVCRIAAFCRKIEIGFSVTAKINSISGPLEAVAHGLGQGTALLLVSNHGVQGAFGMAGVDYSLPMARTAQKGL